MNGTILEKIIEAKRSRLEEAKRRSAKYAAPAKAARPHRLLKALSDTSRPNIIAEFKRASPSKGIINDSLDPAAVAEAYGAGGAVAISVLTEEDFFGGSLDDLRKVRQAVDLPILRKDFIIDEFQIREAAAAGADAILLIVAALSESELRRFQAAAHELGLDALVEVHDENEMETASSIGARLIGVNNRDLRTFEVSLDVSRRLAVLAPPGAVLVSESGIRSSRDIEELRQHGYSAFLVGETLMRGADPKTALEDLTTVSL